MKLFSFLNAKAQTKLPDPLPISKFQIGHHVYDASNTSRDWGRIIGILYRREMGQAVGYYYAIELFPTSSSYQDGTRFKWEAEGDLALIPFMR